MSYIIIKVKPVKKCILVPKDEVKIVSQIQLPAAPLRNPQKTPKLPSVHFDRSI